MTRDELLRTMGSDDNYVLAKLIQARLEALPDGGDVIEHVTPQVTGQVEAQVEAHDAAHDAAHVLLTEVEQRILGACLEAARSTPDLLGTLGYESRTGNFKMAWQERDYATIVTVADKIPNKVLEEDPKLLMWYDQAVTRTGGE
jgi:hypothetical protein